jgi:acyl-coenzyme A thioesterase PaaI-like protein
VTGSAENPGSRGDAGSSRPGAAALQDLYAPDNRCFGCGARNPSGLRLKSYVAGEVLVAEFVPAAHHEAFGGVLNGGIIGTVLDCHSNWAAAWALMNARGAETPPTMVTAEFHVVLKRPTPLSKVTLEARAVDVGERKVRVEATLSSEGVVTATCVGTFVAVREGHPAFHEPTTSRAERG